MTVTWNRRPARSILLLCALAGCSSTFGNASVDASAYAAMNCNELNETLRNVSHELSQMAITRGKVVQTNIPGWIPGGKRVASGVIDRQTVKIEGLQQRERAITAARDGNCARHSGA